MALCAVAVFSFTAAREAQARRILPVGDPGPTILPGEETDKLPPKVWILPPPPIDPIPIGDIRGTLIVD